MKLYKKFLAIAMTLIMAAGFNLSASVSADEPAGQPNFYIATDANYEEDYAYGQQIRIAPASVGGAAQGAVKWEVSVYCNGARKDYYPNSSGGFNYTLNAAGSYSVTYTLSNNGFSVNKTFSFDVVSRPYAPDVEAFVSASFNSVYTARTIYAHYIDSRKAMTVTVTDPDGVAVTLSADKSFTLSKLGDYTVTYSASWDSVTEQRVQTVKSGFLASDLFTPIQDVMSITNNVPLTSQSVPGNGVEVYGFGDIRVRFKNLINLNTLASNTFAKIQAAIRPGLKSAAGFTFRLIDANDASNYVDIFYWKSIWAVEVSYLSIGYRNNENSFIWASPENPGYETTIGTSIAGRPTCLTGGVGYVGMPIWQYSLDVGTKIPLNPLDCTFNPKTGLWYIMGAPALTITEPSEVGAQNVWKGFSSDEIYLEMVMYNPGTGAYNITEVLGQSLSGMVINDVTGPVFMPVQEPLIANFSSMPNAVVGQQYKIPAVNTYDYISGVKSVVTEIINPSSAVSAATGQYFTPTAAGLYKIRYTAEDANGNQTMYTLNVTAVNSAPPASVAFATTPAAAYAGKPYTVPEIKITGGVSAFNYSEVISFGGKSVNRAFTPDAGGNITVSVFGTDYAGNYVSGALTIPVSVLPEPVLSIDGGMPNAAIVGKTCVLPEFTAIDYNYAKGAAGYYPDKWITVNGSPIEGNTFNVTSGLGSNVTIIYCAGNKSTNTPSVTSAPVTLPVVNPTRINDYFLYDNTDMSVTYNALYTQFQFRADKEFTIINPLPADGFLVRLGMVTGYARADSIDVLIEDYYNSAVKLKVSFVPISATTSRLVLNGDMSKSAVLSGSISANNQYAMFVLNNESRILMTETGIKLISIDSDLNGKPFAGFPSGVVRAKIAVDYNGNGTSVQNAQLRIQRISNQTVVNTMSGGSPVNHVDNTAPMLMFDNPIVNVKLKINGTYTLPSVKAYDFCSPVSTVTMSLYDPSNTALLMDAACNVPVSHKFTSYGLYSVVYKISDGAATTYQTYYISVIDEVPPVISISSSGNIVVKAGASFKAPDASVTDNIAGVKMYCFLYQGMNYTEVTPGQSLKINEKGNYRLVYYAVDAAYNTHKIELQVEVR